MDATPQAHVPPRPIPFPPIAGETTSGILTMLGWVVLLIGMLGGTAIWAQFGTIEIPTQTNFLTGSFTTEEVTNPVAIAAAVGVALQSVILCAICIGISNALDNQAEILRRVGRG